MIYYVCLQRQTGAIQPYLDSLGPAAASMIQTLPYEKIFGDRGGPAGHYIFTGHDRLLPEGLEAAALFANTIVTAHPWARILNHPLRTLERYALLRTLHERGINPFNVARLDECRMLRFPLFLRREAGTGGPETGILHDEAEYEAALSVLDAKLSRKDRIAVEFVDTRFPDGLYRKFGVQRIGSHLIPQHMFASRAWMVKREHAIWDETIQAQEIFFVENFPHRDQVMRIFEIARIEYGRIDYGMIGGRVVAFEINTNPKLPQNRPEADRRVKQEMVSRAMIEAFTELNTPPHGPA